MRHSRRRKSRVRKAEINMIPFLDVLLTMLLIFMIATPTINSSIDVKVPTSSVSKTKEVAQKDILVLEVHSDLTYTILYNLDKYPGLDLNSAKLQLNRILEGKTKDNLITQVAADRQVSYEIVVEALSLVKSYGINDVGLITKTAKKAE